MPQQGKLRRLGLTPCFADYASNYALIDEPTFTHANWPQPVVVFSGIESISIPTFQRKLVWGSNEVEK